MINTKNLYDNENMIQIMEQGNVKVFEHQKDLSMGYAEAVNAYFASKMNVRKRQVLIELNDNSFILSPGKMQWSAGNVDMNTNVKGAKDLFGKALSAAVSKESTVKPKYSGTGLIMLEPTYKYILLENVEDWGTLVLDDGLFLACDANVSQKVVARSSISSAVFGNEGLFNLSLTGSGIAVLESPVPREELIEINLDNDVLKIDGNMAIAWSNSLTFTVEKAGKSLIGSAFAGEGLVNVYKGTGKVLLAPVNTTFAQPIIQD